MDSVLHIEHIFLMMKLMKTKVKMIISVSLFVVDVVYLLSVNRWLKNWLIEIERYNIYYIVNKTLVFFVLFAIILSKMIIGYWKNFKAENTEKYQQMKAKEAISEDLDE